VVIEGGPWRGPTTEEWVERIARYLLRDGETLPLVKPLPAPVEEERAGGVSDGAEALPVSPAPSPSPWSEAELREIYGR